MLMNQTLSRGTSGKTCRLMSFDKPANFECFSEPEYKEKCSVREEKVCSAKQEEKCTVVPKRECSTYQEKACNTFSNKVCDTVFEKQCQTGMTNFA